MSTDLMHNDLSGQAADEAIRRIIRGQRGIRVPVSMDPDLDLASNMIISAGAGSGKTTALIERMMALIRAGRPVESLVAITFTRKAAGELQERFFTGLMEAGKQLAERIEEGGTDEADRWKEESDRVRAARENSESAFIGTIHSFCARILRQFPVAAGIPPDFRQVEDADERELRNRFWRQSLTRLHDEEDAALAMLRALEVPDSALYHLFSVCVENEGVEFPSSGTGRPDLGPVIARLMDVVDTLEPVLPKTGNPDEFQLALERVARQRRQAEPETDPHRVHLLELFMDGVKRDDPPSLRVKVTRWGTKGTPSSDLIYALRDGADETVSGRSLLSWIQEELIPVHEEWQHWLHDRVLELVRPLVAGYREERLQTGWLTYDDLLRESARVVRDHAAARAALQEKYRHILVDEFQDTDPAQAALLFHLCAEHIDENDWQLNVLLPGRLFVVGDDKQSIYRFRKADFQAFALVCRAMQEQGGHHLGLTANFRSDARVCDWVNRAVAPRFHDDGGAYQARWEDLQPFHGALHEGPPVIRLGIGKQQGYSDKPRTVAEARALAGLITDSVHSGASTFGDWLLLVRNHSRVPLMMRVLNDAGVPVALEGGKGDRASDVIDLVHNLLTCLVNPDDHVSLAATLTGPWFGIPDPSLLAYRKAGGSWGGWMSDAARLDGCPDDVREASRVLSDWAERVRTERPLVAFEKILSGSGLAGALRQRMDGDVAVGMLEMIGQLMAMWQQKGLDMSDCVREMGRYRSGELSMELFSDNVPFGESVRIMTIHGSKGLQAKRVVLADVSPNQDREPERFIWREGAFLKGKAPVRSRAGQYATKLLEPAGWNEAVEEENRFDRGEENRLLYVAATRAIEQLVICTHLDPDKGKGTWDVLIPALESEDIPLVEVDPGPEDRIPGFATRDVAPHGWRSLDTPAWDVGERIRELSRGTWRVRRPSESETEHGGGRLPDDAAPRSGRSGRAVGMALHTMFEALAASRKQDADSVDVQQIVDEVLDAAGPEVEHVLAPVAPSHLSKFMASDLWKDLAAADRVLTEVPFTNRQHKDDEWVLWTGIVDLAFHGPEGWTIVDYKSDQADEETIRDRHASQIEAYVRAWKELFPESGTRGVIWSTRLDRALIITEPQDQ